MPNKMRVDSAKEKQMMKKISTQNAPAAVGPYSQAIEAGGMIYTSGQIALDPSTGQLVGTTITEQAEQVMKNLVAVLCIRMTLLPRNGAIVAVYVPAERRITSSPFHFSIVAE